MLGTSSGSYTTEEVGFCGVGLLGVEEWILVSLIVVFKTSLQSNTWFFNQVFQ